MNVGREDLRFSNPALLWQPDASEGRADITLQFYVYIFKKIILKVKSLQIYLDLQRCSWSDSGAGQKRGQKEQNGLKSQVVMQIMTHLLSNKHRRPKNLPFDANSSII